MAGRRCALYLDSNALQRACSSGAEQHTQCTNLSRGQCVQEEAEEGEYQLVIVGAGRAALHLVARLPAAILAVRTG
jgi:hypothetical protein